LHFGLEYDTGPYLDTKLQSASWVGQIADKYQGGAPRFSANNISVNEIWQQRLKDVMAKAGTPVYFVPAWPDVTPTPKFFAQYPACDGAMNWQSWPYASQGKIDVGTTDDMTYLNSAKKYKKTFMMGASPLQFKHIDANQNWYVRGRGNLHVRWGQILQLQPDSLEFQTWNDVGEGHAMGTAWPESISGSPIQKYAASETHLTSVTSFRG